MLMGLQPKAILQADLFTDTQAQAKTDERMKVMDAINKRMGKNTLTLAATGTHKRWAMRRDRRSPEYTTDWNELVSAK